MSLISTWVCFTKGLFPPEAKMTMVSSLPAEMKIRHRFLTVTLNLMIRGREGGNLFLIETLPFRLKRRVNIWKLEDRKIPVVWMAPIGGLTDDVMISGPDDAILGVMKRNVDFVTGQTNWTVLDLNGDVQLKTIPTGSRTTQMLRRFSLFSAQETRIVGAGGPVGAFFVRWGLAHERFDVALQPGAGKLDPRIILATMAALSGLFYRAFT
jgi:hypothetical protein